MRGLVAHAHGKRRNPTAAGRPIFSTKAYSMASLFPFPLRRSTTRAAAALLAMAAMAAIADGAFAQSADSGTPTRTSLTVIDGGTVSGTPILVAAGPEQSEKRPLAAFRSIHISVPADSTFTVSATPSIVVTTQANVLPVVETQVEGDRLVVRIKGAVQLQHAVKLEISGPSPESITLSGTGSLHAQDLKSPDLALNISGMATLTAAGDVRHVSASISGTGT